MTIMPRSKPPSGTCKSHVHTATCGIGVACTHMRAFGSLTTLTASTCMVPRAGSACGTLGAPIRCRSTPTPTPPSPTLLGVAAHPGQHYLGQHYLGQHYLVGQDYLDHESADAHQTGDTEVVLVLPNLCVGVVDDHLPGHEDINTHVIALPLRLMNHNPPLAGPTAIRHRRAIRYRPLSGPAVPYAACQRTVCTWGARLWRWNPETQAS